MKTKRILTIRTPSGLSGDMLVAGLAKLADIDDSELNHFVSTIGVDQLNDCISIKAHHVNKISGWHAHIDLPHEHSHRNLGDISSIIDGSRLTGSAKSLALTAFEILARAEASVHNIAVDKVHFHEVGALDSILDTCLAAALLDSLAVKKVYCSPLPMCDGVIKCAHGLVMSPAPAVQEMLAGIPVYGADSYGETVTPTALAFLLATDAEFGVWPSMHVTRNVRSYGGRVLEGVPNGALFALGQEILSEPEKQAAGSPHP